MAQLLTKILVYFLLFASPLLADQWPLHNDSLNDVVQWDHYSFELNGQRLFVFAGEWHYWRIPVPELWIDILEKIKAAGFTAFAMYVNWAYHAPNNHTVDFSTGAHDITPILEMAKEVGLYVLLRPGPYINAETNAGGFPLWVTTGEYGSLRNDDSRYTAAWEPYFTKISEITSKYQISSGGNVITYQIENEFGDQWTGSPSLRVEYEPAAKYMELLEANARQNGVDIPLIANEPNIWAISWGKDWSNSSANVDVVGLDSYPSCWSCDLSVCTGTNGEYVAYEVVDYYDYFQETQPTMPSFLAEFQGGSYNPWGGPVGGCPGDIGPDFANLFYRWNIGQRVTAINLYMIYGGTNWGAIATPVVATSYDYSSPISENRTIGAKYYETKLLTMFTRAAKDLTVTDLIGNGTQYSTNSAVQAHVIQNPNTNGTFYVTLHTDSSSSTDETFQLRVQTSFGALSVPRYGNSIRLNGHQSKIIVTDFQFGSHKLLYSTAEVLTYAVLDDIPTLALWVPTGESGEFSVLGSKWASVQRCEGCSGVGFYPGQDSSNKTASELTVSFTQGQGMSVIELDTGVRILLLDRESAYYFWAPALNTDPSVPEDQSVLVQGPHLVRSAEVDGSAIHLKGDSAQASPIEVFASKQVQVIFWNDKELKTSKNSYGSLQASLPQPPTIELPSLGPWRYNESLPEKAPGYKDTSAAWIAADHMNTSNPTVPTTYPVLYADEYGFHNSIRIWRGYFSGNATGVILSVQGGDAFGFSVWLNGQFLDSYLGDASVEQSNLTIPFNVSHISTSSENVLVVVHDDTGHDETTGALNPRGILQATLVSDNSSVKFSQWRVAGTAGGETNIDSTRGPYNEGGLYAERVGWHLPGFKDDSWSGTGSQLNFTGADIKFYRTVTPLTIPEGVDVSISFELSACGTTNAFRAQLFVNGYQMGRFNPYIGNQVEFPVPPGILEYTGDNTIGLSLWAQTESGACAEVDWKINYVLESSLDVTFDAEYLRPGWASERLQYS